MAAWRLGNNPGALHSLPKFFFENFPAEMKPQQTDSLEKPSNFFKKFENLLKSIPAKMMLRPDLTLQGVDLVTKQDYTFRFATYNDKNKCP